MQLSVIIVNYNVRYFLEQCLFSVRKALRGMEGEVIVVDNASRDGSREYLEPRFPDVQFFWNETNPGFAKANNQALDIARGEFILFLNPDTIVPEDCFHKCIAFLRQQPDAGALGIRMLDGTGRFLPESRRAFPSPLTSFFKLSGLTAVFPRSPLFARYYMGHLDPEKNHETDVLAGAFMMVKKSVLHKSGGFDEAFFMYGEDIDLSYRIQKAGFKNYYFAETPIIHFKGESTKKGTLNYIRIFYRAMNIFVTKHYGGLKAAVFHLFIYVAMFLHGTITSVSRLIRLILFRTIIKKSKIVASGEIDEQSQILVVANTDEFRRITGFQRAAGIEDRIQGRIAVYPDGGQYLGLISDIKNLSQKFPFSEIIFCENGLSFKEIIHLIPGLKKGNRIRISASGSLSVVGSDSKNRRGTVTPHKEHSGSIDRSLNT